MGTEKEESVIAVYEMEEISVILEEMGIKDGIIILEEDENILDHIAPNCIWP